MNRLVQFRQSLAFRFLLVLGGLVVISQLIFAFLVIARNYRIQRDYLAQKALTHAGFLSAVSQDNILANNFYPLETLMRETAADPDFVYSVVVHADGRNLTNYLNLDDALIRTALSVDNEASLNEIVGQILQNASVIEVRSPIVAEGIRLGEVRLAYRTDTLAQQLRTSLLATLSTALLIGLLLALFIISQLNAQVRRPLLQLGDVTRQIAAGHYDKRLSVEGTTEIQMAQTAFNEMAQQLQENLAELNKLSFVASRTKNGVVITNAQGQIEWINIAFSEITGYQLPEVAGRTPGSVLQGPESDPGTIELMRQRIRAGEPFEVEIINYHRNGQSYWVAIEGQPVYDAERNLIHFVGIETDITDRILAEKQLQTYAANLKQVNNALIAQESQLRMLLEIATQSSNSEVHLEQILRRGAELLAMDEGLICQLAGEELLISESFGTAPIHAAGGRLPLANTILAQAVLQDNVLTINGSEFISSQNGEGGGEYRPVAIISAPLTVDGQRFGALAYRVSCARGREFTTAEQDFVHLAAQWLNVTLERQQARDELTTYARELERSNRELQDFAYVASHDLQEPLRKIQAFGSRMESVYADVLDERGLDYLQRMQRAAQRMQQLIHDLLSYSRVSTRTNPPEPVNLTEIARDVLSDLDYTIERSHGTVHLSDLGVVEADPVQMRQLFQNLLGNALKFVHPDRQPVVKISCNLPTAESTPGKHIIVSDNGIGFDEKYRDRVFNIFQRLHGRDSYEGTGVGLAICRKIVQRHHGMIDVTSRSGEGTQFHITLPLTQPREAKV
ncbi:MAG: PAS domain-containing protein [Anaerolineales bacterium]|nr:PAS domain-containing protein [Anaerolineales bacterium]